jgi:hypothetical protein
MVHIWSMHAPYMLHIVPATLHIWNIYVAYMVPVMSPIGSIYVTFTYGPCLCIQAPITHHLTKVQPRYYDKMCEWLLYYDKLTDEAYYHYHEVERLVALMKGCRCHYNIYDAPDILRRERISGITILDVRDLLDYGLMDGDLLDVITYLDGDLLARPARRDGLHAGIDCLETCMETARHWRF